MALRLVCPWLRGKPRPRACRSSRPRRRALTRIEVLVVLGIALLLVILFVVMFPHIQDRPPLQRLLERETNPNL